MQATSESHAAKQQTQWARQIPNSLNFSQEQVTFILRHSLRSQYQDLLAAELPDRLQVLVDQLEKKHASPSGTP
jgi:hypothetical protein